MSRIANDARVQPFINIADDQPDWASLAHLMRTDGDSPVFDTLGVIVLSNGEDALSIMTATTPTIWQGHTMFLCSGRKAIDTGRAILTWMFGHGADVVWGATPRENRKARWFNRQIGMHPMPSSDDETEVFEVRRPVMIMAEAA